MNELQIFNNQEFGQIRTTMINNEPYFMLADVCRVLEIKNSRDTLTRLNKKGVVITDTLTNGGKQQATFINDSNLYKLAFTSRKKEAEKFTDWVTSEVLPAIRKTGSYSIRATLPDFTNPAEAARAWANEFEAKQKAQKQVAYLTAENQMQAQIISEFKPKVEYVDIILQSNDAVTTTQIAADYGLSAKKLNKILHDEKIQHKVNDQWILYKDQMNKGYTKSETIQITKSDGRRESKIYTKWTQKGRLKIHEILTDLGFIANFDYEQAKLFE